MNHIRKHLSFFSKEDSAMVGAIAILLMIWHHLFVSPDYYTNGIEWYSILGNFGNFNTKLFARYGNVCVQMFAIISGYALFCNPSAYTSWKLRIKRLIHFLIAYWIIFALFLLVAWFNTDSLPSLYALCQNLIGLHTGPKIESVNVSFAWYVSFYIAFVLISPLMLWLFYKGGLIRDLFGILVVIVLIFIGMKVKDYGILGEFFYNIHPLFSVAIGMLCAKYEIFYKLHSCCLRYFTVPDILFCFVGLALLRNITYTIFNNAGGVLYFFNLIFYRIIALIQVSIALELIKKLNAKNHKFFIFIGSLSMYLWFLHGIFFTGKKFLQIEIYSVKEPVLIFILVLAIIIPIAYLVSLLHKILSTKVNNRKLRLSCNEH